MRANPAPMNVLDYCRGLNDHNIQVNEEYQRGEGIWSPRARSFFIESIILEYPIPKLFLYSRVDLESMRSVKEIVDGQQRSRALQSFFNNKLRLSKDIETEELRGKRFKDINGEYKKSFVSYSLPIDQFDGVSEEDVQEAFRRMNANNVPLNDQEQRNARYQGPFKWFVLDLAKKYRGGFASVRLFSRREIIRMGDARTVAEILSGIEDGFITIKATQIDRIYARYNKDFPLQQYYESILSDAFDWFLENDEIHERPFLKPHMFQSIVLAFLDYKYNLGLREHAFEKSSKFDLPPGDLSFEFLARALEEPEAYPTVEQFYDACSKRTNVAETRALRFRYFRVCFDG